MRGTARMAAAGVVFTLCALADGASAAKDPLTGGMLSLPGETPAAAQAVDVPPGDASAAAQSDAVPAAAQPAGQCECPPPAPNSGAAPGLFTEPARPIAAPAPAAALATETVEAPQSAPAWGLLARGGYFGLPNFIADQLFLVHPDVKGMSYGFEIRYNGEGGRRNGTSVGIAVDIAKVKADGEWQQSEMDKLTTAGGDISMLAITVTKYWYIFPSWYVHPYIGFGIGAAHAQGFYKDESERIDADIWIPVIHVPVGLACEFGERLQVSAEGRFIDGIAIGASLQLRF